MSENIPVIRLRTKSGVLVARDGVVLSFFIHRNHEDVAPAIWRALRTYVRAIPPNSLNWYSSDDGDMVPLDDQGWEHNRKQLLERSWGTAWVVELFENASEAGGYQFDYHGRRIDERSWPTPQNPATSVAFTFPTEYLRAHGPEHLRALALEIARELPFSFGYASLAFVSPHGAWYAARAELLDLLTRYMGLDLYHVGETSTVIGAQARGAYWLTFLGQPLLGQLGGIERLRRELAFPGVSLLPLPEERLLISLGEWPDALDTKAEGIPPQYPALAYLLKPFLYEERSGGFSLDKDQMNRWLRRLCP
ncbi:DUF3396 domain-containing protein [Myxococcus sp. AM011]|uniref:type VI immunity family protein n=1 Tax=Myxococcus sp. AM011 TaxID=2745200 RepID=UPI001596306D|nr:type VI immunity family protein [Myxococcus sp. AM011]NVJ21920.1 DUF3396 domain-containing protein [Myxococcus sp. AM011]